MDQKFWDKIDSFGQNGEYDKIVREIKKLPADKMDMELINVLGRAYMYLGDLGNALDTYLSFIGKAEEDTLNADIWLYSEIGQCLGRLERYEEAIKRLEKSLKLIEADEAENGDEKVNEKIFIVSELGYLHAVQGKAEEALKYFYTAKDLGRNDGWIYLHLYHNLKTTKGEEEALKYFEEQAKIEDKNPVLLEALGNIYMLEAANYEKAEKTFQKAFALSGDGQQLFNRGIGLKDKKNAEKYLELAREGADNVADEFIDEYEEELDQLEDMIDEL